MAVLRPLKVVLENYPEGRVDEHFELGNNPEDPAAGTRHVPFSREIWIESEDFHEVPPPKFFRLSPGTEVRLRGAYLIRCTGVVKDPATGAITEVRATYDPETRSGNAPDGRKVKAHDSLGLRPARGRGRGAALRHTVHAAEDPEDLPEGADFTEALNPSSLETLSGCKLERGPRRRPAGDGVPVRARGLLRGRWPRLRTRGARVQPHGDAEGRMGAHREEAGALRAGPSPAGYALLSNSPAAFGTGGRSATGLPESPPRPFRALTEGAGPS